MFLSEKIAEMVAMGSSVKEINKFKDTYSAEIIKGKAPADAMEFAEAHFGGPGSGRYPAGSGGKEDKSTKDLREAMSAHAKQSWVHANAPLSQKEKEKESLDALKKRVDETHKSFEKDHPGFRGVWHTNPGQKDIIRFEKK